MSDQYHRDERVPTSIPQSPPEVRIPAPPRDEVKHPVQQTAASPSLPPQPAAARPASAPSSEVRPAPKDGDFRLSPPPSSLRSIDSLSEADLNEIADAAKSRRQSKWQAEFERIRTIASGLQKRGMTLAEIHDVLTRQFGCTLPYKQLCARMTTNRKRKSAKSA